MTRDQPPRTGCRATSTPSTKSQDVKPRRRSSDHVQSGLRISERKALLLLGDLLVLNVALLVALEVPWQEIGIQGSSPMWFLVLTVIWLAIAPAAACYELGPASHRRAGVFSALRAGTVVVGVYLLIPYVTAPLLRARVIMLVFVIAALVLIAGWRALYATLLSQQQLKTRALVIGAGLAGRTAAETIRRHVASAYEVVGYIDDDPAKQGTSVAGLPVLGGSGVLMSVVREEGVIELVLAITHNVRAELHKSLIEAFEAGVRVTPMSELYESVTARIAVEHVGEFWYAALPKAGAADLFYSLLKRSFDITVGLLGTCAFAIVLPFAWLAIKLDSPGPVLYTQVRTGKNGKRFNLSKLRSMVSDAESYGEPVWATDSDPRATRVGRFLRQSHLDELPQFVSVLTGDMSLIGPRPERPSFVAALQEQIPFYKTRLLVKPGLTGWAQVKHGYGNTVDDALTKLQYDLYYIKHQSLVLDLSIVLKTIWTVLRHSGT